MRFFVAMVSHETNTFSPIPDRSSAVRGPRPPLRRRAPRGVPRHRHLPGRHDRHRRGARRDAGALAGRHRLAGRPRDARTSTRRREDRLLADLEPRARWTACCSTCTGPWSSEGLDDGEGDLLAAVRSRGRPAVPIAVTLDFHANVTRAMVDARRRCCTATRPIRTWTWPRAAARPPRAWPTWSPGASAPPSPTASRRMLPPLARPAHRARARCAASTTSPTRWRRGPRVLSISIFAGFPLADIPDAGLAIYVATDGDPALAEALAERAGRGGVGAPARVPPHRAAGDRRGGRARSPLDGRPDRARRHGRQHGRRRRRATAPRSCASCCGWARARPTVACLWDAAAVHACVTAGRRQPRHARRRRQGRRRHGAPLDASPGTVRTLSDGRFVHKGPMMRGLPGRLGPTAVLDVNDVKVILISNRWQTLDPEMIRFVGIDPAAEKILVVKSIDPLPRGLRADRQRDHRGGRARALVVQPRALHVHARAAAHLPARSDL